MPDRSPRLIWLLLVPYVGLLALAINVAVAVAVNLAVRLRTAQPQHSQP